MRRKQVTLMFFFVIALFVLIVCTVISISYFSGLSQRSRIGKVFPSDSGMETNLISDFAGDLYECTGECYCEEDSERRIISSLTSKPLYIMVAVFSTAMAMKVSQKYMQEECQKRFSGSEDGKCEMNKLKGFVKKCRESMLPKEVLEAESEDDELVRSWRYDCRGYCVPIEEPIEKPWNKPIFRYKKVSPFKPVKEKVDENNCIDHVLTSEYILEEEIPYMYETKDMREYSANVLFCQETLDKFCKGFKDKDGNPACQGWKNEEFDKPEDFSNGHCRVVEEFPAKKWPPEDMLGDDD